MEPNSRKDVQSSSLLKAHNLKISVYVSFYVLLNMLLNISLFQDTYTGNQIPLMYTLFNQLLLTMANSKVGTSGAVNTEI